MTLIHKTLKGVELKANKDGTFRAVFATFNVKDLDGDWTLPGAFENGAEVLISDYNHSSWQGAKPIGKGVIGSNDREAWVDAQLFLDTIAGADAYALLKNTASIQEFSYGFDVLATGQVTEQLREIGVYRVLAKMKVHEVSPVLIGAGIGTRTVDIKSQQSEGAREYAKFQETCRRLAMSDLKSQLSDEVTYRVAEVEPPEPICELAALTADTACVELRATARPIVKFYDPAQIGAKRTGCYFKNSDTIWIRAGLSADELVKTVRHETYHFVHFDASEDEARAFEDRTAAKQRAAEVSPTLLYIPPEPRPYPDRSGRRNDGYFVTI